MRNFGNVLFDVAARDDSVFSRNVIHDLDLAQVLEEQEEPRMDVVELADEHAGVLLDRFLKRQRDGRRPRLGFLENLGHPMRKNVLHEVKNSEGLLFENLRRFIRIQPIGPEAASNLKWKPREWMTGASVILNTDLKPIPFVPVMTLNL